MHPLAIEKRKNRMNFRECACCGQKTLDDSVKYFDYCPVCGWQDDPIQNKKPDYDGGANYISLNEARKVFAEGRDLRQYRKEVKLRHREERLREGRLKEEAEMALLETARNTAVI